MAQTFCHVCYGTSLTFEHGVLVCDACGTRTQTYQEETEFQQGIDDARGRRRAAGSAAGSQVLSQAAIIAQQEKQSAKQLKDAALLYARCLQHLLKVQGRVLSSRFGVSTDIASLLRQMWLSHIPSTGILEPKPQTTLRRRGSGAAEDAQAADDEDGDGGGEQQAGKGLADMRAANLAEPYNMKRLFWKLLHPQVTLQLCFLGCVLLREAVTFFDIMSWALDGQLPFQELPHLSMQVATGDALAVLPVRCLQAQLRQDPLAFCTSCCTMAKKLGLQLPRVAGEALLLRSVKELGLPQVVYEAALQLYTLYLLDSQELQLVPLMRRSQTAPYTWLAAVLMIAIKLLYGLGSTAGQLPLVAKAPGPPGGWQHWGQQVLDQLPGISSLPLTEEEAVKLGPVELRQYIHFCRQYVFAGQPVVSTLDDLHRLLTGWYDAADPARAQQQRLKQSQQQQVLSSEDTSCTTRSVDALVAAGTVPASTLPDVLGSTAAAAAPVAAGSGKQQQVLQQPEQQESLLDLRGPELGNYGLTGVGGSHSIGATRMEPDLAAVVVAVAGHERVSPSILLECMRKLEKQMVAVESAAKIVDQLSKAQAGQAVGQE